MMIYDVKLVIYDDILCKISGNPVLISKFPKSPFWANFVSGE